MEKINFKVLIICLVLAFLPGIIGSYLSMNNQQSDWFNQVRPELTPPNWVFGVVWPVLYLLIGISLYLAWTNASERYEKRNLSWIYGINLIANGAWSYLYFGINQPKLALYDILLVWISIIGMMVVSGFTNKKARWILLPYLIWVGFASYLNWLSI